jgi:ATP-binding cassette subfamily C (CFTR/MRP) protein 1
MRVKGGLVTLIYRKSLIMSNGEKAGRASGDIVNLQSVDAVRIGDLAQYGQIAWSGPFQIILAFVSLYNLVGWQAFTGVAVMVISVSSYPGYRRRLTPASNQHHGQQAQQKVSARNDEDQG